MVVDKRNKHLNLNMGHTDLTIIFHPQIVYLIWLKCWFISNILNTRILQTKFFHKQCRDQIRVCYQPINYSSVRGVGDVLVPVNWPGCNRSAGESGSLVGGLRTEACSNTQEWEDRNTRPTSSYTSSLSKHGQAAISQFTINVSLSFKLLGLTWFAFYLVVWGCIC